MLKISDITKFTLQDYPNKTACIIWFLGCNMRCKFCHNVEFLKSNSHNNNFLKAEDILDFLRKRVGLFDGVVLSGGECTLDRDIIDFIKAIRNLGFEIKIDTNGLNFDFVMELVEMDLLNFVALDFKAPKYKFNSVTQISEEFYEDFEKTLKFLIGSYKNRKLGFEIRTTVHSDLLQEDDINEIISILDMLEYEETYYIQNFRNDNKLTLANLGKQKYLLNRDKIVEPKNFRVEYRNFF